MLKRLLIALLVFLVIVVIAADRVGAVVASHVLAGKLQTDEGLPSRPSTTINGIPFLTQAFGGKYSDVDVTAHHVPVDGVPVTTLTAHLHGMHVPFSKVIGGSVSRVPVDLIDGTAYVSYADANSYLAKHPAAGGLTLRLAPGTNGQVKVAAVQSSATSRLRIAGLASVAVSGNVVTVAATKPSGHTSPAARRGLPSLRATFPLQGIPFQIQLRSVHATATGLLAYGEVQNAVLGQHPG